MPYVPGVPGDSPPTMAPPNAPEEGGSSGMPSEAYQMMALATMHSMGRVKGSTENKSIPGSQVSARKGGKVVNIRPRI